MCINMKSIESVITFKHSYHKLTFLIDFSYTANISITIIKVKKKVMIGIATTTVQTTIK